MSSPVRHLWTLGILTTSNRSTIRLAGIRIAMRSIFESVHVSRTRTGYAFDVRTRLQQPDSRYREKFLAFTVEPEAPKETPEVPETDEPEAPKETSTALESGSSKETPKAPQMIEPEAQKETSDREEPEALLKCLRDISLKPSVAQGNPRDSRHGGA
jgi:hypothetical protein